MRRGQLDAAPNYTNAALVMALVNLLWVLLVIWLTFGMPVVLAVGYGLDRLISLLARRRT